MTQIMMCLLTSVLGLSREAPELICHKITGEGKKFGQLKKAIVQKDIVIESMPDQRQSRLSKIKRHILYLEAEVNAVKQCTGDTSLMSDRIMRDSVVMRQARAVIKNCQDEYARTTATLKDQNHD